MSRYRYNYTGSWGWTFFCYGLGYLAGLLGTQ